MDIPIELAVGGLGLSIALVVYAVLAQADEKSVVRESLRQLDGYETVDNVRDQELLNPLTERAIMPVLGALTQVGRRFTPVGYVDNVRRKFVLSGRPSAESVDRFLAIRVITVLMIPAAFYLMYIWNPLGYSGRTQLMIFALLVLALGLGPDAMLNRRVEDRQKEIRRQLPDVLDLLVISCRGGAGFRAGPRPHHPLRAGLAQPGVRPDAR